MDNATRKHLLQRHSQSGFPGSIIDVFKAYDQGIDLIGQFEQQNNMQVAETPQQQQQGLRPAHQAGDTNQSMIFPNVPPNTPFNTKGMKAPINIQKYDEQGHLVKSYENVPPGISSLPTGPQRGTVIETPANMESGGGIVSSLLLGPAAQIFNPVIDYVGSKVGDAVDTFKHNLGQNLRPYGYGNAAERVWNAGVLNEPYTGSVALPDEGAPEYVTNPTKERQDLLNHMLGQGMPNNSMSVSQYKPTDSTDESAVYYSSPMTEKALERQLYRSEDPLGQIEKFTEKPDYHGGKVLGNYTITKGSDDQGSYISYYDKWDLNPMSTYNEEGSIKRSINQAAEKGFQNMLGVQPAEVYGRIYYDPETGRPIQQKQSGGGFRLKKDAMEMFPALKALGNVKVKADKKFTKDLTGIGDIEYFAPGQKAITYPSGARVKHPGSDRRHTVLVNPETNDAQNVALDMLHGLAAEDPTYSRLLEEFGEALGEDDPKHFYELAKEEGLAEDGYDQFRQNYIDGKIRNLLFQGSQEDFDKAIYNSEERQQIQRYNPIAYNKFLEIENHLKSPKKTKGKRRRIFQSGSSPGFVVSTTSPDFELVGDATIIGGTRYQDSRLTGATRVRTDEAGNQIPILTPNAEVAEARGRYSPEQQAKMRELLSQGVSEEQVKAQVGAPQLDNIDVALQRTGSGVLGQADASAFSAETDPGLYKELNAGKNTAAGAAYGLATDFTTTGQRAVNKIIGAATGQETPDIFSTPSADRALGSNVQNVFPSETLGIENPYGAFAVDLVSDPGAALGLTALGRQGIKSGVNLAGNVRRGMTSRGMVGLSDLRNLTPNPYGFREVGARRNLIGQYPMPKDPMKMDLTAGFGKYQAAQDKFFEGAARRGHLAGDDYKLYPQGRDYITSKTPLGKSLGSGSYGQVHEFAPNPNFAVKVGRPGGVSRFSGITDDFLKRASVFKDQPNIAVPLRANRASVKLTDPTDIRLYGDVKSSEISVMRNLRKQSTEGALDTYKPIGAPYGMQTPSRDAYALAKRQVRALRDRGIAIDMDNPANMQFNRHTGKFDIFDLENVPQLQAKNVGELRGLNAQYGPINYTETAATYTDPGGYTQRANFFIDRDIYTDFGVPRKKMGLNRIKQRSNLQRGINPSPWERAELPF